MDLGCILTNAQIWSPDSQSIVYDVRSDLAGSIFDGTCINRFHVKTGHVETLYQSQHGAHVGVATVNPVDGRVIFIHGPEHPTPDWSYSACHRDGVIWNHGEISPLEARNLIPPFTKGALRGGTHVHTWDSTGQWVSSTYEDHYHPGRRTIALSIPCGKLEVPPTHPRNRHGTHLSVVAVNLVSQGQIRPGNSITRAFEEAWIPGKKAITFIGQIVAHDGRLVNELFRLDYPEIFNIPLAETVDRLPPAPTEFRPERLTSFARIPGHSGLTTSPRHWPRTSFDGRQTAFLIDDGQLCVWVDDDVKSLPIRVRSAFTWHPTNPFLYAIINDDVCEIDVANSRVRVLAHIRNLRPEACVVSPDGRRVAVVSTVGGRNKIEVISC